MGLEDRSSRGSKKVSSTAGMGASDNLFEELLNQANATVESGNESTNDKPKETTDKTTQESAPETTQQTTKESVPKETQEKPHKEVPESTPESTQSENEDDPISKVVERLAKKEKEAKPTVLAKGGALKIGVKKKTKSTKVNFTELNENKLYELQKSNKDNEHLLALNKKTFSIRPDIEAIMMEVLTNEKGGAIKGLQAKFVNNAFINELIRIGVLDESSANEIEDY